MQFDHTRPEVQLLGRAMRNYGIALSALDNVPAKASPTRRTALVATAQRARELVQAAAERAFPGQAAEFMAELDEYEITVIR